MKLTVPGKDIITVDESSLDSLHADIKIHLIKFKFSQPTQSKIDKVFLSYPHTNRFIIDNNVKIYNDVLKSTSKKYYVMNRASQEGLISFFRKNNKVLLCIPNLIPAERRFVLTHALDDVLRNLEIIMIDKPNFEANVDKFKAWNGNVILYAEEHKHYL
jgi:hypothetical protein